MRKTQLIQHEIKIIYLLNTLASITYINEHCRIVNVNVKRIMACTQNIELKIIINYLNAVKTMTGRKATYNKIMFILKPYTDIYIFKLLFIQRKKKMLFYTSEILMKYARQHTPGKSAVILSYYIEVYP